MTNCQHPFVRAQATPGSFWFCPDCEERFYLHPWDHTQHGYLCSPKTCGASLEDALMNVLKITAENAPQDLRVNARGAIMEHYRIMAKECLRQMKWCSYQATLSHRASEGYDDKKDALDASRDFVELAPHGWKADEQT